MRSGHIAVLAMVILIAAVVCLGMYLWAQRHASETKVINEEQKVFFEAKVDSLEMELGRLREQLAMPAEERDTMYTRMMREEIDYLRRQIMRVVDVSIAASGMDSVAYLIQRLKDSTFVSHYGDYDQPAVWHIAPERLGMMGKPAIGPLVRHLDSAQGFELGQTLYALNLAAQHETVAAVTGGELPILPSGRSNGRGAVEVWQQWAVKWNLL